VKKKTPAYNTAETGALASSIWHLTHHQQLKLSASIAWLSSRPPHFPYSFSAFFGAGLSISIQ
jgi:hypothetical protein